MFMNTVSGGEASVYTVGGCLRDSILGLPIKDVDLEVHGMPFHDLTLALEEFFGKDSISVHGEFVVACVTLESGFQLEFSVPREEVKVSDGHKGFKVFERPDWGVEEAVQRRDFTVNALMCPAEKIGAILGHDASLLTVNDLIVKECQPFLADLVHDEVVLRPVSDRFKEDPLRVLRAMRFLCKLPKSRPSMELIEMAKDMVGTFQHLSKERVHGEFKNMFLTGHRFVEAFDFLRASGWLVNMPRLNAMACSAQDPVWHPEGDVLRHTCHCLNEMAKKRNGIHTDEEFLQVMWAILIHDAWKPETFVIGDTDGRIHNPDHDMQAGKFGVEFLRAQFDVPLKTAKVAAKLAELHMQHHGMTKDTNFTRAAKKLAVKMDGMATAAQWADVVVSDVGGRPPLKVDPESDTMKVVRCLLWSLEALALQSEDGVPVVVPLITGKEILEAGVPKGAKVGEVKAAALKAQLDDAFDASTAVEWLKNHLSK